MKQFKEISDFNAYTGLPAPRHALIDIGQYPEDFLLSSGPVYPGFYRISLKYGLEEEREKGFMYFSSPDKPITWDTPLPWQGYYIQIAAELIAHHQHLDYSFLNYGMHEALYLKEAEGQRITALYQDAVREYQRAGFAMDMLLALCNLMFAHIAGFYERQFGERKQQYNKLVEDFFAQLQAYYGQEPSVQPSVAYFADQLCVTPNYLSDVVRYYTGKPALEHIHQHIITVARAMLSEKGQSIAQIADRLGFEYPNYFARLFKKSTGLSPSAYRNQ